MFLCKVSYHWGTFPCIFGICL